MQDTQCTAGEVEKLRVALRRRVGAVVSIPEPSIDLLLVALVAGGHVLIEGVPGIGKTLLARTLARVFDCDCKRIQFTNDLMPSDIIGTSIWRPAEERFTFHRGPIFSNILLADEINRTSPRTLSCLLEAMENGQVSVEGKSLELGTPFFVLATRNPIEFHGTFPIPEAALDRFLMRLELGYPSPENELSLYLGKDPEQALADIEPVFPRSQFLAICKEAQGTHLSEPVARYAHSFVKATREHESSLLGASPRAALAWLKAGRARAFLFGRDFVLPDDLKALALPVLGHRIFLQDGSDPRTLLEALGRRVPVPI